MLTIVEAVEMKVIIMQRGIRRLQQAMELEVEGKILRGMFHLPKEGDMFPTVIMFHGFTGHKLESHRMFVKFSRLLSAKGIAVARFDFSGSGESDGDFEEMTFSGEVREGEAILNHIRSLSTTDPGRIGLLGLSMGGAVASVVAGRNPHDIKTLVLWSAADIEVMKTIFKAKKAAGAAFCDERGFYDIGGLWLNPDFYDDLTRWDTYNEIAKFQGKALIVHGREDETVPCATARRYYEVLGERAESVMIEGADHTYNRHDWEMTLFQETLRFLVAEL
ncbi:MAG: alpha/beta hydrolase [Firmicutes bacterium]|nr:alpha/beta hydrolase [Bacillota bacterium]HXL04971.1 alpha/beta hydrolase [Bacillota bacterium]